MKRRNLIILIVGLVAVILIGIFASKGSGGTTITARVQKVAYGKFETRLPETGVIQRPQIETMTALAPGNVDKLYVHAGDHVHAGELLVTLSNPQLIANAESADAAYTAAAARAKTAQETNAVVPATNAQNLVQAQYNLELARANLNQAITDQKNGTQSGLGYGGTTAAEQRVQADANVATAESSLRDAQRVWEANKDLFANKAISKDTLDTSFTKYDQARIAYEQTKRTRESTYLQLQQNVSVLADRVKASRDAVRQAEAALEAARIQSGQNKYSDVVAAKADAAARLSDKTYADDQVSRLTFRAPFDGIVQTIATQTGDTLRPLQPGDSVTVGQSVISIASNAGFIVRARVDEQDISQVHVGQSVKISGEDLGTKSINGHVAVVGDVAQKSDDPSNTSRQVITTIALDSSLPFLRDGMTVDVDIATTSLSHVIEVPTDAVRKDGSTSYVWVVKDKKPVKTTVKTGPANDAQTIITSGLKPGDTIVVDRNAVIAPSTTVNPAPTPSPGASPSA
jgi:RND family efflux transporter MFP subunit